MTLGQVSEAAASRRMAEDHYRSAILASVSRHGITKTAKAAGVSRQAVQQLVKREDTGARDRLAVLNARWQALVEWRAGAYTLKDAAAITASRNARAKKRAKRGLGRARTVREEAFALAETELLELVRQRSPVEGLDLEILASEILEAELLRDRLGLASDSVIPF